MCRIGLQAEENQPLRKKWGQTCVTIWNSRKNVEKEVTIDYFKYKEKRKETKEKVTPYGKKIRQGQSQKM